MEENRKNLDNVNNTRPPPSPVVHPNLNSHDVNDVDTRGKTLDGMGDAIKESIKEEQKAKETFDNLVNISTKTLFQTKSLFPFQFFPTEVIIDLTKVTIIKNIFFGSRQVHSVFIADVTDVLVHNNLMLATLEIVDAGFVENSILIKYLPIKDAQRARKIIQGLVIVKKQNVDLSKLDTMPDLVHKLETLGAYNRADV